ncbi:hypothetical protein [Terrabacter sp. MAHUQ-38]|uniref:hypothetical protein n=1 Tax=unclassified Terrabacter TaxID=2630222 RepID=UPI00165E5AED|nr:hypothetical protein [Terrabacter sp. MAHUQ-38]MBC9822077.1 hypothetical protein [Terrabacter sp. MAHUQ-38]
MKTFTTRVVALSGALAISLGAAACSKSDTPTPASSGSASSASSGSTSSTSSASSTGATDAPEASEILTKAKDNALAAKSGAFVGEVDQSGKTIKIDFKGTSDGKTADIAIEMEGDGKARIISLADGIYIQGDQTFWKKQGAPASVQKAGDKFIKAPASAGAMTESLSLKSFLEKAFGAVTPEQLATEVESETVSGVDCWVLSDSKGKKEGALYVSKDAFQVVRFTGSVSSPGQLDFSKWNEDLGIKAPEAGQVMKIG